MKGGRRLLQYLLEYPQQDFWKLLWQKGSQQDAAGAGPQPPPPLCVPGSAPAHKAPPRDALRVRPRPRVTAPARSSASAHADLPKAHGRLAGRSETESPRRARRCRPETPTLRPQPGPGHVVGPRLRTPHRLSWGRRRDAQCHSNDSFRPPGGDLGRALWTRRTEVDKNPGPYLTCVKC